MGKRYVPDTSDRPYRVRGIASWYGRKFHGNPTANGERYDMFAMTAAHTTLPIPSYVRVTRVSNGRSVIVRINDRGPFLHNRVIDLSYAAAYRLDMVASGSAEVIVERITPQEIRSGSWRKGSKASTSASTQTPEPAPTPAPAATQWAPSVAASGPVYLQLGAFQEEANARALAARAAGDMSMRLPVEVDQNAARVFRVRVGPFRSREQALEASGSIERNLGITPSLSLP
jgi:rare lipoprotein A